MAADKLEKIIHLCKNRGFIFPGSEIYGGLANSWDFGPYGVELRNNIKRLWWKTFVQDRDDMVGLESTIIMNTKVWETSGHLTGFNDMLVECKACKNRFRTDDLKDDKKCPTCGKELTSPRQFNTMFKTNLGPVEGNEVYLRPETAQGMFVDFKHIAQTSRKKIPFGIAQIGKAFRNEITPGNFIFRLREFEQMEIEYFIKEKDWEQTFEYWLNQMKDWVKMLGIKQENLVYREIEAADRAHYSKRTVDIEYQFPFGQKELYGIAYRTDFDLARHQEASGKDLTYFDEETKEKYLPHVIEPTFGVERSMLAVLLEAYKEGGEGREADEVVLALPKVLAPVKVAVFPLVKNKEQVAAKAREVYAELKKTFNAEYDESGTVGKRYRRQDEIGTPYCVTIDFETLDDQKVTVRDRDTMQQERVAIADLVAYLQKELAS